VKEQAVTSFHLMLQTARRCRNVHSSQASRVFPIAFVVDHKLFAGVNGILRISNSELNRRLMIKSAASFRMRRHSGAIPTHIFLAFHDQNQSGKISSTRPGTQ
jgi:hypothetical protein